MKVVHVTPYFPPDGVGGVGEVVLHIHEALGDRGHDSLVVTSGRTQSDSRVKRYGRSPVAFTLLSVAALAHLRSADVAHFHHGEGVALLAASRLVRHPASLLTLHVDNRRIGRSYLPITVDGYRLSDGIGGLVQIVAAAPIKRAMDVVAMRLAHDVSFVSRATAHEILDDEADTNEQVIWNAVPDIPNAGIPGVPWAEVLFVGTPNHFKRIGLLPFVLRRIRQSVPDARLRIVGFESRSRRDLHALFCEFGLEHAVTYEGSVRSNDVTSFYRSSSVLLVPSAYEGMPMVILEALRSGLPVVATDVGGVSEIQAGSALRLVGVDDVYAMAEACVAVIQDSESARDRGVGSVQGSGSCGYSLDAQIEHYIELYQRVVRARSGALELDRPGKMQSQDS